MSNSKPKPQPNKKVDKIALANNLRMNLLRRKSQQRQQQKENTKGENE